MPICSMPHHPRPIKLWPLLEHAPVRVISSSSSSFSYSSGCCVLWRQWHPFLWQYYGMYHYITYMDPPSLFNIVINSVHNSYCSCVPDEHRALALGMQWVILRLLGNVIRSWKSSKIGNNNVIATLTQFKILLYAYVSTCMYVKWMYDSMTGTIPGPVLTGYVIDTACGLWQDLCGARGSCEVYDRYEMSWRLFTWWCCVKVFSGSMYILAMIFWKEPAKSNEKVVSDASDIKGRSLTDVGVVNNGFHSQENGNGRLQSPSNSIVANGRKDRDGVAESTYMWGVQTGDYFWEHINMATHKHIFCSFYKCYIHIVYIEVAHLNGI